jgi:hypothetical protein
MEPSYAETERKHLQQQQPGAEIEHRGLHSRNGSGSVTVPHIPGELQ